MSSHSMLTVWCYAVAFTLISCAPSGTETSSNAALEYGVQGSISNTNTSDGATDRVVTGDHVINVNSDSKMERIILSVVQQDASASDMMSLPDDLVINALQSNIETLQDQLDFCEEGLIERISHHRGEHSSSYAHDGDGNGDGSESRKPEPDRVQRKTRSASGKQHQGQGDSIYTLARIVVERLSSRIQYLKKSLSECYVVYSKWNIRHS